MTTARTTRGEGIRYRVDRPTFAGIMRDPRIPRSDLGAGDRIPHFDLPTTDAGRFCSESIAADGRPALLVFGSLTCPATESAGRGLLDLHRTYGDAIRSTASTASTARCTARSARAPARRRTTRARTRMTAYADTALAAAGREPCAISGEPHHRSQR